jgi:hypothetical protein
VVWIVEKHADNVGENLLGDVDFLLAYRMLCVDRHIAISVVHHRCVELWITPPRTVPSKTSDESGDPGRYPLVHTPYYDDVLSPSI